MSKNIFKKLRKMHSCAYLITCAVIVITNGASIPNEQGNGENGNTAVLEKEQGNDESENRDERSPKEPPPPQKSDTIECKAQEMIPMRNECYKYFICARPGALAKVGRCPGHRVFHHQQRTCLKIPEAECRHSMCKTLTDKYPDPYSKTRFLTCKHMYPEVMDCPNGQVFNKRKGQCKDPTKEDEMKDEDEEDEDDTSNKASRVSWAGAIEKTDSEIEKENSKEKNPDEDPHEEEHSGHSKYN